MARQYAEALRKFTQSENQEIMYQNSGISSMEILGILLNLKPNLLSVVVTRLDNDNAFDSINIDNESSNLLLLLIQDAKLILNDESSRKEMTLCGIWMNLCTKRQTKSDKA